MAKEKKMWIYGTHAVLSVLKNAHRKCHRLLITENTQSSLEKALSALDPKVSTITEVMDRREIDRLLPQDTRHQGIAAEVSPLRELSLEDICDQEGDSLVMLLDQVTDPHNVGAILRSAHAFGAHALITTERNSPSVEGTIAKTASGALEHLPLVTVTNLARAMDQLKQSNFWCIGLDERGEASIEKTDLTGRIALIMGAEGKGLRRLTRENCDILSHLPTVGSFSTLNVSTSAAISL